MVVIPRLWLVVVAGECYEREDCEVLKLSLFLGLVVGFFFVVVEVGLGVQLETILVGSVMNERAVWDIPFRYSKMAKEVELRVHRYHLDWKILHELRTRHWTVSSRPVWSQVGSRQIEESKPY